MIKEFGSHYIFSKINWNEIEHYYFCEPSASDMKILEIVQEYHD